MTADVVIDIAREVVWVIVKTSAPLLIVFDWEDDMAVTYKKLFHLLIDRGIATAELTEQAGFSANILTRLRRDQYVSLESIEKLCLALDCGVDDILEFTTNEEKYNEAIG